MDYNYMYCVQHDNGDDFLLTFLCFDVAAAAAAVVVEHFHNLPNCLVRDDGGDDVAVSAAMDSDSISLNKNYFHLTT
jgi:hypothetical protein